MVVVSGAGTGIGRAVARRLAADGFHVPAVGRRTEPLDRLAKELAPHLDVASADLATVAGATAVAEHVHAADRGCAGVVAAAGGLSPRGASTLDGVRQEWLASFESSVLTAVLLVEALRAALVGDGGGTANVVAPGFVPDTEFWAGRLTGESRRERAAQTLVGREGTPEEVASPISWLPGPDGGWVTGQVLSPNGGVVLVR
jgi:3-oxoacyl-[acyl-carrier protein] reductase